MRFIVAILKNELNNDHNVWLDSCRNFEQIENADVIDILSDNWLTKIRKNKYHAFILKPSGLFGHLKQLYDERVLLLSEMTEALIYPSVHELLLYENKRYLRDWLMVNELPHPATHVFYQKNEALEFIKNNQEFPLVGKTNIGASGSGVVFLKDKDVAMNYISDAFGKGIFTRTGPKFRKGTLLLKLRKLMSDRRQVKSRIHLYRQMVSSPQRGFVILQEFIPHTFEWRCVRIGDSFFAHKKVVKKDKSSGTLIKDYSEVPLRLLDFVREVTEKTKLSSVAVDIFEHQGGYLINEIQCIFGQSDPYQMLVGGAPGRYRWLNDTWEFEEGMFNTNYSYDLRISHLLQLLDLRYQHPKEQN